MTLSKFKIVGVEFAVEKLSKFRSDMASGERSLNAVKKAGSLLGKAFSGVGKILGGFLGSLRRIGEFLIAGIIFRGLEAITRAVRNMIGGLLEAGAGFQQLQIRLEGIIAADLRAADSTLSFTDSMEVATGEAKELFKWITNLALQTPFDIQDVADTITLARAYGLTAERAKEVTKSVIDFAAGMGLSNLQMKKIIENFGQMIQQGKITGTELRDLARGSLVPVNAILQKVAENMGNVTVKTIDNSEAIGKLTTKLGRAKDSLRVLRIRMGEYTDSTKESTKVNNKLRFDRLTKEITGYEQALGTLVDAQGKQIKLTELSTEEFRDMVSEGIIPVDEFMTAFTELVGERFPNAGERAGRTIKAVIGNLKDLFQGLVAFNVVTPVLDVIATEMDQLIDTLTSGERGERLQALLENVGEELVTIAEIFFGVSPGGKNFADVILDKLREVRNFVVGFRNTLEDVFAGRLVIGEFVGLQVQELLRIFGFDFEFADAIGDFIANAIAGIQEKGFLGFLGDVAKQGLGSLFDDLFPKDSVVGGVVDSLLITLDKLAKFWDSNKDDLLKIFTEFILPISLVVFDFALSGLSIMIEFLGDLADWMRKNPELATFITGISIAVGLLAVAVKAPFILRFSILIGAGGLLLDLLLGEPTALDEFIKNAQKIAQEWIIAFVLGIVNSEAFKFFNDEVALPLAELIGKSIPTSAEIAARLNKDLGQVRDAGNVIGSELQGGMRETLDPAKLRNSLVEILGESGAYIQAGVMAGTSLNQGLISTGPLFKGAGTIIGQNIITGIVDGINQTRPVLTSAMGLTGQEALEAFKQRIGARSPAKEFAKLGITIPQGIAQGIMKAARLPVQAISMISNNVQMAAQVPSVTNNSSVQNFNMNIKTNARSEPIIGNFRTMQALGSL